MVCSWTSQALREGARLVLSAPVLGTPLRHKFGALSFSIDPNLAFSGNMCWHPLLAPVPFAGRIHGFLPLLQLPKRRWTPYATVHLQH